MNRPSWKAVPRRYKSVTLPIPRRLRVRAAEHLDKITQDPDGQGNVRVQFRTSIRNERELRQQLQNVADQVGAVDFKLHSPTSVTFMSMVGEPWG
jgi:hypothetical protein